MTYTLHHGDCLEVLRGLPEASVDAVVTDPPAGISFMNKAFDSDRGGRDKWIKWLSERMGECLRVLKPGGHALVWALPRTSHWTATAIEDAGFEIRDRLAHIFSTGFPKSTRLGLSELFCQCDEPGHSGESKLQRADRIDTEVLSDDGVRGRFAICQACGKPKDDGSTGTALKPSVEDWWLARKPLGTNEGTIAANVLAHGTGGLNIDASRVRMSEADAQVIRDMGGFGRASYVRQPGASLQLSVDPMPCKDASPDGGGRWPPHLLLTHAECRPAGTKRVKAIGGGTGEASRQPSALFGTFPKSATGGYGDADGLETVEAWDCTPGCPVAELDRQSGELQSGYAETLNRRSDKFRSVYSEFKGESVEGALIGDRGGASRFFPKFAWEEADFWPFRYCQKAARAERDAGLDHLPAKSGGQATDRADGSAGLSNPRAGAGRTGGRHRVGVRNVHPT